MELAPELGSASTIESVPPEEGFSTCDVPAIDRVRRWRIALDTGGTFTDAIGCDPKGAWHRRKVPSDGSIPILVHPLGGRAARVDAPPWLPKPSAFLATGRFVWPDGGERRLVAVEPGRWTFDRELPSETRPVRVFVPRPGGQREYDAPMIAVHAILGLLPGDPLPPLELRLSTTRGTNALLERRGARTALLITEGFEDLLEIGDQSRPDLFARSIHKRDPLCAVTLGVPERVTAEGTLRRALTSEAIDALEREARATGATSVAISCVHALARPDHERAIAEAFRARGWRDVAVGHALSEAPRFLSRTETAVVHATLAPVIRTYLEEIPAEIRSATFMMTSAGGLQRADRYVARDSLLSGPAGGVAGVAEIATRLGRVRLLGLDMGGTSTDVARYDHGIRYRFETRVGAARVAAPAIAIESVAAGGGSICRFERGELRVGPESAGADPGPACYGRGGPLTLTDVHLLLDRVDARFGSIPLDRNAASAALAPILASVSRERGERVDADDLLHAFLAIADERMAAAIAAVTVREGARPSDYAIVAFGGAGGLHACSLADRLGIDEVIFPLDAGVLSARGVFGAAIERFAARAVLRPLEESRATLAADFLELDRAATLLVDADLAPDDARQAARRIDITTRIVSVRLDGQEQTLDLPFTSVDAIAPAFGEAFRQLFGYDAPARRLVVEAIRVVAAAYEQAPDSRRETPRAALPPGADRGPIGRAEFAPGQVIDGPRLIVDEGATAFLPDGWRAEAAPGGDLVARRIALPAGAAGLVRRRVPSPIAELDLFACRLEAIATGMGELLRRTAFSANVKERLDFSCAVLDGQGTLLQNAPHLPVHLGSMGVCVRMVAEAIELAPGDVAITNHPAFGGSHLPDVTLVTPVDVDGARIGYVASRAHHAEIGGTRPGSFPPDARSLAEEGVVIPPMRLVEGLSSPGGSHGQPRFDRIEALLRDAPHPSRAIEENLADLRAALAANARGASDLAALAAELGLDRFRSLSAALLDRSEQALRALISSRAGRTHAALEHLDDGAPIAVAVTFTRDELVIDFTGSAPVHAKNFNAPLAVVRAATLYALRLLVGEDIPMNEGLLRPVRLIVPEGMLNPPFSADPSRSPPVVAGNTETSQRVTDALLRAFELCAGSQGTMNNLLFGNARYGAYETICGGSGATVDAPGASAVHTHMTNTRITDPEVLERRCPVVVRVFSVRRGSGGAGRHRGGDGVVREIEFREPTQVSILAQHRVERPYGLAGGEPGMVGVQWHIDRDGLVRPLPGVVAIDCAAGEAVRIETPGGGGFGPPTPA